MQAEDANGRSVLPKIRKTRALLAVLALAAPRPILRTQLIALLWSRREIQQARGSLRQSLYELQDALAPLASGLLEADRFQVALRTEGLEVVLAPPRISTGSSGRLLEDLIGIDPALDAFIGSEQRRLSHRALAEAQEALSAAADPDSATAAAAALLTLDRGNERAWQAMIQARLDQGQRSEAVACFEECRAALEETARIAPSAATFALLEQARSEGLVPPSPAAGVSFSGIHSPTAERLRIGIARFRAGIGPAATALAAGVEEELVLALTPFRWISCIPVVSLQAFVEGGSNALGLDCLLEGTVQESVSNRRVTVRLLDLRTAGEVIWVGRFDRDCGDMLQMQEEIAAETAAQLEPKLLLWEGRRAYNRTGPNASARELMSSAILQLFRMDRPSFETAGIKLEQAFRLDPNNPTAIAWLAQWHLFALGQGWAPDIAATTARARELAHIAISLAPDDGHALSLAGHVQAYIERKPHEAIRLLDRAIEANPNLPLAWCRAAFAHSYAGNHDQALTHAERARRMTSGHPLAFLFEGALAVPHLFRREYEAAILAGDRAIALNPGFTSSYKTQLAALGHLHRFEEAALIRDRLLMLEPHFTVDRAMARSPILAESDRTHYAEGLRLAGLP